MKEWLESLIPWGTEVIIWVQSYSNEWLVSIFAFFTFLGYEEFYLILFPTIYWCVDKQVGAKMSYLSLLSAWLNNAFKYLFAVPRPSDPRIVTPYPETSPSFPSGHAQGAVVNWGYLAYQFRSRILWVVAIVLMLCIGLSRIVLGVHYPQDVIAGWIIGLIVLVVYIRVEPPVSRWLETQKMPVRLLLAVMAPLALIFVHPPDVDGLYPAEGSITAMGALVGFGVGLLMERAWVRFREDGEWWRRGLRLLIGLVILVVFYAGPRFILPDEMAYGVESLIRIVRYALVGWTVSFLCPWLFVKLRLAKQAEA